MAHSKSHSLARSWLPATHQAAAPLLHSRKRARAQPHSAPPVTRDCTARDARQQAGRYSKCVTSSIVQPGLHKLADLLPTLRIST